jgi:hypothetical protein
MALAMKKVIFGIVATTIFAMTAVIATFLFTGYGPTKERELVEGLEQKTDPVQVLKSLDAATRTSLRERELKALQAEPLDRSALPNLITLESLEGSKNVEQLSIALAERGRRNAKAQITAMQIELAKQEFDKSFSRLDGVLRARPELGEGLFAVLSSQLVNDKARAALGRLLANNPPWRSKFINSVVVADKSGSWGYRILSEIRKAKGTPTEEEKRSLITHLFSAKQFDQSYFVWLDLLQPSELLKVRNVFDGGFDTSTKNMLFNWNFFDRKTARIEVGQRSGKSGDATLKMDFFSDKEVAAYAYQMLRLAPNEYDLSFELQVDELKSSKGIVWRLSCLETPLPLGESKPILEKGPWETRQFSFKVPDKGCATQYLRLETKGVAELDRVITGRLSIDNITVEPVGARSEKKEKQEELGQDP